MFIDMYFYLASIGALPCGFVQEEDWWVVDQFESYR
jgi:hypothetical protein